MQRKCTCNHKAPSLRILRSPEFNHDEAKSYRDEQGSGDVIADRVLSEIYDYHSGRLVGPDGVEISLSPDSDTAAFDALFGEDARRFINRYRQKATRMPKNRLDHRCVFAVTILHLARQIRSCRTQGRCSR